jgi:hypothetical protein
MKTLFLKLFFVIVILTCTQFFTSCSKDDPIVTNSSSTPTASSQYFFDNVLNHDLSVSTAVDNGTDITAKCNGYTFKFAKNGAMNGTVSASNDLLNVMGTWSIDADYNKIIFAFDETFPDFAFFNKQWQFSNRATTMIELEAANGESDILKFQRK